jgi:Ca-activated chloride channel family protein
VGTGLLHLTGSLDQGALLVGSGEDRYLVFEVSADDLPGDVRRPVNLAVVVDTSGSMAGAGKITHARMAARELVGLLHPEDTFSLVTFDDRGRVRVASTPVTDRAGLDRAIQGIQPDGGTNLHSGLELGLEQLSRGDLGGVKRVVLLSDGQANVGITDPNSLARLAGSRVEQGITVSGLGLGLDYNEDLLAAMSDSGGGRYRFVDRPGQLAQLFTEELHQMTAIAGRGVALDVDLPDGVALQEVYGWDSDVTRDGYRVFLGDMHGGETRKVVARVRVSPTAALGEMTVGDGRLSYFDPETEAPLGALAAVSATVTADHRVARASLNAPAADKAAQAVSATYMEKAIRAYEAGDEAEQRAQIAAASGLLRSTSSRTGNAALDAKAVEFDDLSVALDRTDNASDDGQYQIKKRKEANRVFGR